MSLLKVHVELPPYSTAFDVNIQPNALVLDLKHEISRQCPGRPASEGQRLIWRGRVLNDKEKVADLWQSEPRVVHLAVHPSAWTSTPPQISPPVSHSPIPASRPPRSSPQPTLLTPVHPASNFSASAPTPSTSFILFKHQEALATLSSAIRVPAPVSQAERDAALAALKRGGWRWPAELDSPYPPASTPGVLYDCTLRGGQPYLSLRPSSAEPSPRQVHALKVLSATFTILSMPPPPTPTYPISHSQNLPVPPHVNQLLQQLGLPAMRPVGNHDAPVLNPLNPNLGPNVNANPAIEVRRIRLQPILAPLLMLVFRTTVLLYFFAPARKPVFGILILAWMLYEIWQPIRNGLRGIDEANPEQGNPPPPAPREEGNLNPNQENGNIQRNAADAAPRPGAIAARQAGAVLDRLGNLNIAEEESILNETPGTSTVEPTLGHKTMTFVTLLLSTLHPAIWDRRRAALRRREGTIRTEANLRNAPLPDDENRDDPAAQNRARLREELVAQFNRRPRWVRQYMERVVAEDWIDDSD